MNRPLLIYCYDAWCGWCYGFSRVIHTISSEFSPMMDVEVLSGGMILPENPVHIGVMADYILKAIPVVEQTTGVTFGEDFMWHIRNSGDSDWYPHSEKPAVALCVLKEMVPINPVSLAADLQFALHEEGRDLTDNEAYRHLLEKYGVDPAEFYEKLESDEYIDLAHQEFSLVRQLKVDGYPAVFVQTTPGKVHMVASGYTAENDLRQRIQSVLNPNP